MKEFDDYSELMDYAITRLVNDLMNDIQVEISDAKTQRIRADRVCDTLKKKGQVISRLRKQIKELKK